MPEDHRTRRAVRRNLWHHSETMKGTVALVVIALVATWAVLLLPATQPSAPSAKRPTSTQAATPATPQEAVPARPKPAEPAPPRTEAATPAPAAAPASRAGSAPSAAPHGQGDVRIIGSGAVASLQGGEANEPPTPTQLAQPLGERIEYREPTGELGEGVLSPDFKLLEESYIQEPRDGNWAIHQELRIRNMLLAGDLGERITLVNCQSSVCRVQLEPHGRDPYGDLLRVPGLAAVLGIDAATPYSLNAAELIVYAKPEALPEPKR